MTAITLPASARRVIAVSALTNLSDGIRMTALPLLALTTTKSPALVATVFAAGQAPWLIFGLWAGRTVDGSDRVGIARRAVAVRTILLVALAVFVLADAANIWMVVLVAFALGIAEVLTDTASGSLIPMFVNAEHLERANSRLVAGEIAGNELLGPALGGLLFAIAASLPFFTNAALLAAALLVLAGLPHLPTSLATDEPAAAPRARDGLQHIRHDPTLRTVTFSTSLLAIVDGAWFALMVLFVEDELGLGASAFGLFLAAGAVGGLAGAWLADRNPTARMSLVSASVFAVMGLPILGLALFPSASMTVAALVASSGAFAVWNVFAVSARQRAAPIPMLGRVGAAYRTIVVAAGIAGALAGGALATATSIRISLLVSGVVVLVATVPVSRAFGRVANPQLSS